MDLSAVAAYNPPGCSVRVGCRHEKVSLLTSSHYASFLSYPLKDGFTELKELGAELEMAQVVKILRIHVKKDTRHNGACL